MSTNILKLLAFVTIALAGCSEAANRPLSSCEPMVAQICSNAAEAQLHEGTLMVSRWPGRRSRRGFPFVVPVFTKDGALATEMDCYASIDSQTYSIGRSDLVIPPASQESVDFLKDRHFVRR